MLDAQADVMTLPSDPAMFGIERSICLASRLTGWNSIRDRAQQLSMEISDDGAKEAVRRIKDKADKEDIRPTVVDDILREICAETTESLLKVTAMVDVR